MAETSAVKSRPKKVVDEDDAVALEAAAAREEAREEARLAAAADAAADAATLESESADVKADVKTAQAEEVARRAEARAAEVRAEVAAAQALAPKPPGFNPDDNDLEVWKNVTESLVILKRVGAYGVQNHETIQAGRSFGIKPEERRLNQHEAANPDLDVFANGILRPIKLIDEDPDSFALWDNPNNFSDEEARGYLQFKGEFFLEVLEKITNATAVQRLRNVALDPRVDGTVSQMSMIDARIAELTTRTPVRPPSPEDLTISGPEVPTGLNPVTPR